VRYLQSFQIFPDTPAPLLFLERLSRNMYWCWDLDAIELFRRISPRLWEQSGHNPLLFSTLIPQQRLNELAKDDGFLAHQERVKQVFEKQIISSDKHVNTPFGPNDKIAYFSMEYGIHESLPFFAGGLGVLAGDHLKAASDISLPLVGIGLLYQRGYFHQHLDHDGWQQEEYPETSLYHLPVNRATSPAGEDIIVSVQGPEGVMHAVVWEIKIGRISLLLLDTNLSENPPEMREITARLYAADGKIRLAQEVLLGIGGMKALQALGINPIVTHMNEGHCAFAGLERMAQVMKTYAVDSKIAKEIVTRTTVFTTHTPVAAGHDEFPCHIVRPCLLPLQDQLAITVDEIIKWGQPEKSIKEAPLSMFVLAQRMAQSCNGVSELHGKTARRMWAHLWDGRPEDEVPITHVTNGIHIPSWISIENYQLLNRYLGPEWYAKNQEDSVINRIEEIYDEELWRAHEMGRSRLIRHCRSLMAKQYSRRNAPKNIINEAESVLDQDILTIVFARRFATYKRANLLLHDPERFEAILTSPDYPVQFIFAGKAHPRDNDGKELIKRLVHFARKPGVRHKFVFIEDYDINIARLLIQGADVWLNTPRRPFEACGTSGIKAAANGVLNASILDGWWCEGYSEGTGWRIGNGEEYEDYAYQDVVESQALYNLLEDDIIPCFYDRKDGDLPNLWLKKMKASMKLAIQHFCAKKMVNQYHSLFYLPAAQRLHQLVANSAKEAIQLQQHHQRLYQNWQSLQIERPVRETSGTLRVGNDICVSVEAYIGNLHPEEVDVELYYGTYKSLNAVNTSQVKKMMVKKALGNGKYVFDCHISCDIAGRYGFTARIVPRGDELIKNTPGLITWA